MADFTLDTSGVVRGKRLIEQPDGNWRSHWGWPDLDPFTQGYVEALLRDLIARLQRDADGRLPAEFYPSFSDLSPEALAIILADCGRVIVRYTQPNHAKTCAHLGREFWQDRQRNGLCTVNADNSPAFPPLTPTLGDDGKVHLEASK